MNETIWKRRFVAALYSKFVGRGLLKRDALADAEAHADDHYPQRGPGTPEEEAEAVFARLDFE